MYNLPGIFFKSLAAIFGTRGPRIQGGQWTPLVFSIASLMESCNPGSDSFLTMLTVNYDGLAAAHGRNDREI